MGMFRVFLMRNRALAGLLVALALAIKALVPAGYMVGPQARTLSIEICDGQSHQIASQIVVPQTGKAGGGERGKVDGTCSYSVLGHAGLAGADTLQLALALAFIMALGFATPPAARVARASHLRPPLRGPPALARLS